LEPFDEATRASDADPRDQERERSHAPQVDGKRHEGLRAHEAQQHVDDGEANHGREREADGHFAELAHSQFMVGEIGSARTEQPSSQPMES